MRSIVVMANLECIGRNQLANYKDVGMRKGVLVGFIVSTVTSVIILVGLLIPISHATQLITAPTTLLILWIITAIGVGSALFAYTKTSQ